MEACVFLCLHVKNLHESTKHACFHVFSPFSAHPYIIMVKGLLSPSQVRSRNETVEVQEGYTKPLCPCSLLLEPQDR